MRRPVTVVCVFNDEAVRRDCLDRSLEGWLGADTANQFLPMDNRRSTYPSAGAALNAGVRQATNEYVAFVHQDVFLHSMAAVEEAAGLLAEHPELGLLGPVGVTADGAVVGRIRDRVMLLGQRVTRPVPVDSLDEVFFMARRADLLEHPLSEDPELAWHAYAVEYGVRMRSLGKTVVAADIPMTHNSLTINLARLDEAHAFVAQRHPDRLPVRPTGGTVRTTPPVSERSILEPARQRYRTVREGLRARRAGAAAGTSRLAFGDIRRDIDDVLARTGVESLSVLNLADTGFPPTVGEQGLVLQRRGVRVRFLTVPRNRIPVALDGDPTAPRLVTNVRLDDLPRLRPWMATTQHVLGVHAGNDYWVLLGPVAGRTRRVGAHRAATP